MFNAIVLWSYVLICVFLFYLVLMSLCSVCFYLSVCVCVCVCVCVVCCLLIGEIKICIMNTFICLQPWRSTCRDHVYILQLVGLYVVRHRYFSTVQPVSQTSSWWQRRHVQKLSARDSRTVLPASNLAKILFYLQWRAVDATAVRFLRCRQATKSGHSVRRWSCTDEVILPLEYAVEYSSFRAISKVFACEVSARLDRLMVGASHMRWRASKDRSFDSRIPPVHFTAMFM